jgi:hypothetical protein
LKVTQNQKKSQHQVKYYLTIEEPASNNNLINKSVDSDNISSIFGLISNNTGKIEEDSYPTSNELNIFESFESKYKTKQYFFRNVTKTFCDISSEENRRINDNILLYYKGNSLGLIGNDLTNNDWYSLFLNNSSVHEGNNNISRIEDIEVNSCILNENLPERNKIKFTNLLPVNVFLTQFYFNILVLGRDGIGKTTFIKSLLKEFEKLIHSRIGGDDLNINSDSEPLILSQCDKSITEEDIQIRKTLTFESFRVKVGSNNFKIIDSPGLSINTDEWVNDIIKYINRHVYKVFK